MSAITGKKDRRDYKRGLKFEIVLFSIVMIKKYKLNEKKVVFTKAKRKIATVTTNATERWQTHTKTGSTLTNT